MLTISILVEFVVAVALVAGFKWLGTLLVLTGIGSSIIIWCYFKRSSKAKTGRRRLTRCWFLEDC